MADDLPMVCWRRLLTCVGGMMRSWVSRGGVRLDSCTCHCCRWWACDCSDCADCCCVQDGACKLGLQQVSPGLNRRLRSSWLPSGVWRWNCRDSMSDKAASSVICCRDVPQEWRLDGDCDRPMSGE